MVRKTNFLSISVLVSEIGTYMSKKKISLWISQKCFKTTQRNSLSVCGSLYGEKQFLLIFIRSNWFDQKKLFKPFQIFLRICPIWKMVRKINFLSFSELLFWDSHFFEKKSSLWISPKMLQNNRNAYFSSMCLTLWRKTFFVNIYPILLVCSKKMLFKQIQIFLRICPFQIWKEKQTFWVFQCSFLR